MQANSCNHKLFHFHLSFCNLESVERKGKNDNDLNILRMKRAF